MRPDKADKSRSSALSASGCPGRSTPRSASVAPDKIECLQLAQLPDARQILLGQGQPPQARVHALDAAYIQINQSWQLL